MLQKSEDELENFEFISIADLEQNDLEDFDFDGFFKK